jgi:zinc transport system ATP-binding protein
VVRLSGVGAGYGAVAALSGVTLEVRRGEVLAITGPNGAGKTTLLRVLAGLAPATAGAVEWAGGRRARIGYVPQQAYPDDGCPVTVREFLRLAEPGLWWWQRDALGRRERRIRRIADEAGCGHLLLRSLTGLSGGESQRVLLAYALLRDAEVLLLDEPQTGLDPESTRALAATLRRLVEGGDRALVLVSHDLHFVGEAADRVVCLRGHVCSVGPAAEMLASHLGRGGAG